MDVGESWAYRARQVDPLVEVTVVRFGTQRPPRVLVRFVDVEFEGREEWVPPTRLKAPWGQLEDFEARERRWERVRARQPDEAYGYAAEHVVLELIDEAHARLDYPSLGVIRIHDLEGLAGSLGSTAQQLCDHPDAFVEDGVVVAPWEVTELVVATAARRNPEPILNYVLIEKRKAQHEAIHGRHYRVGRSRKWEYTAPELCVELDGRFGKPMREVLRTWCGAEAVARFDEVVELRKEIRRVGDFAQAAIDALRSAGRDAEASRLQRKLGTPVEMLRVEHAQIQDG